ncbi:MAG: class B sortase [Bulleidia sp.]|nr:class B sortase [Bulleidia sp.]
MKKRKLKKSVRILSALVAVLLVLAVAAAAVNGKRSAAAVQNETETAATAEPAAVPSETTEEDDGYIFTDERIQELRDELKEDQKINPDVKAILVFKSELVHDPVLQGTDNNHYLYVDWKTGADQSYGSIMLDYMNDLDNEDEMNTIIYGHYIYEYKNSDRTLVFTPLSQMTEAGNYADNKYVALVTDKEIRYYVVGSVFNCPMVDVNGSQVADEGFQFNLVEYDTNYFSTYMRNIKNNQYYTTGVQFEYGDKLLSLQTCIEDYPESRQIVLCKELERVKF